MRVVIFILAWICAGAAEARDLTALAWMNGCWRLEDARGQVTEVWQSPRMPVMLGYNFTVLSGSTTDWGQMRIETRDEDVVMLSMPKGRGPILYYWSEFSAARSGEHARLAFDGQDRRYPQRIIYEREADRLTVTYVDWRSQETVFGLSRIDCGEAGVR